MAKKTKLIRSKDRSTQAICQEALKCFIEKGVEQVTLVEIAKRAKVPRALIHYYYPNFESLMLGVVEHVVALMREQVTQPLERESQDPKKALISYINSHFRWAKENPKEFSFWLYFYYLASVNPKFKVLNTTIRNAGRERVANLIYRGLQEQVFKLPAGINVNHVALEIQSLVTGTWVLPSSEQDLNSALLNKMTSARVLKILGCA